VEIKHIYNFKITRKYKSKNKVIVDKLFKILYFIVVNIAHSNDIIFKYKLFFYYYSFIFIFIFLSFHIVLYFFLNLFPVIFINKFMKLLPYLITFYIYQPYIKSLLFI